MRAGGLISLHPAVTATYYIDFVTSVVLLSVYFLPVDRLIPRLIARLRTAIAESPPAESSVSC